MVDKNPVPVTPPPVPLADKPSSRRDSAGAERGCSDHASRRDPGAALASSASRRSPGHRGADMRDTVAEMAERAQIISQEAGSKVAAAMKDVISAGAGIAGFAIESARDLVQYMVKRGQMTPEEADKLIKEAEAAHDKRRSASREGRAQRRLRSRPRRPRSRRPRRRRVQRRQQQRCRPSAQRSDRWSLRHRRRLPSHQCLRSSRSPHLLLRLLRSWRKWRRQPSPPRNQRRKSRQSRPQRSPPKPAAKSPVAKPAAKPGAKASKNAKPVKPAKKGGKH